MRKTRLNLNPFHRSNPLSLKDAAIIATVTAGAVWILTFVADATVGQLRTDPLEFLFNAAKTYAVAWAGNFLALAGLEKVVQRATEGGEPHG